MEKFITSRLAQNGLKMQASNTLYLIAWVTIFLDLNHPFTADIHSCKLWLGLTREPSLRIVMRRSGAHGRFATMSDWNE